MAGGGGGGNGGGKRKTHWAVRRKNKKARQVAAAPGDEADKPASTEDKDRRSGFPEEIHPGSYAAKRKAAAASSGEDGAAAVSEVPQPPTSALAPKRRYGMWVAFCGKNYSGMQMNEGVQTIEAELERALFEAGAIAESNYGFLQKIGWSRAGRTDKGVHAAGQMVTAKLHIDADGEGLEAFRERVNALLPADIRIMEIVPTTKNFNAKMSCDKRTYEYLAPTFIFAPRAPCEDVSARRAASAEQWPVDLLEREDGINAAVEVDQSTLATQRAYRMDAATHTRLLEVLRVYEGTHNFHNFTSKLEPTSPKCQRYIMRFSADAPFVENGLEWVRLRVTGQSFLLHHIRKMIGTAVDVVAGVTPIETITRATGLDKMDLPKAPSVGLYLAQAHFEIYNRKLAEAIAATHPALDFTSSPEVTERIEAFKREHIFRHIIGHEAATRTYAKWLRLLDALPFDYVARPYAQWKQEKEELSAITNRRDRIAAEKALREAEQQAAPTSTTTINDEQQAHTQEEPATEATATSPTSTAVSTVDE